MFNVLKMKLHFYQMKRLALSAVALTCALAAQAQCIQPSRVTPTSRVCDSATITWTAVAGAASYIYAVNQSATPPGAGAASTATTVSVGNLLPSTLYYAHVRSNCTMSVSPWTTDTFRTPACGAGHCPAPVTINFTTVDSSTATISWSAVAGAIGYEYVADRTFPSPTVAGTATTATSANLTGLTGGTAYYFHVRAKCSPTTFSAWKNSTPFITNGSDPNCPAVPSITINSLACDSVSFSWPAQTGASGYAYSISTTPTPVTILSINNNNVTRRNLTPSTQYYIYVRTSCTDSRSAWKIETFTTPACGGGGTTCNPPTGITSGNATASSIRINWAAVTGATGYEYIVNQSATTPATNGTAVTTNSATVSGLAAGTAYFLHVRSRCNNTYSSWTTPQIVRTLPSTNVSGVVTGSDIIVYPNPASHSIRITLPQQPANDARMSLISTDGRHIRDIQPSKDMEINIEALSGGIYFIRYTDQLQNHTVRFMKQ